MGRTLVTTCPRRRIGPGEAYREAIRRGKSLAHVRARAQAPTPNVSHGPGSTSCKARAIVLFPELDPPFSTITWVTASSSSNGLASGFGVADH